MSKKAILVKDLQDHPFKLNISFGEAMKKALNTPIPDSKIFKKVKTKKPKN